MNTHEFIVLHHSADPSEGPQFNKIDAYHRSKGWGKIGYHFLIEKDGTVREGRGVDEVGAHTLSGVFAYRNMNARGIGICLAGDFTKQTVPFAQLKSLADLVDDLQARFAISDDKTLLHRQVKGTQCPGVDLMYLLRSMVPTDYRLQLERVRNAKKWATPARLRMLERLEQRLLQRLGAA